PGWRTSLQQVLPSAGGTDSSTEDSALMRLFRLVLCAAAVTALLSGSASRAQDSTPLALALEGTLTQQGPMLPWPLDPTQMLALDVRVRTSTTASSSEADAGADL